MNGKLRTAAVAWVQGNLCALPLWEVYRSFFQSRLQIGPLALEEAWLLLFSCSVFCLGCLAEKRKKVLGAVFAFLGTLAVYTLLHAWHAAHFDPSLFPSAAPDFATECYYVLRLYLAPAALLAGLGLLNLKRDEILSGIKSAVWLFCGAVILGAVSGFSYASYLDGNQRVAGGIFSWFSLGEGADLAAYTYKGPFSGANALGCTLLLFTPVVCADALQRRRKRDLALTAALGVSSVLVSTKIAAFGFFLAAGLTVLLYLLSQKERKTALVRAIPALAVLVLLVGFLLVSPGVRLQRERMQEDASADRGSPSVPEATLTAPEENRDALAAYLDENGWDHFINEWFIELYPAEEDPLFWRDVLARPGGENRDNRRFKTELIGRVLERDGRALTPLLGLGRTSGVPYSERDLVFQRQVYGWAGVVLLLSPFALALLYGAWVILRRGGDLLFPGAICVSLAAAFAAARVAGHVFDTTLTTTFLAVIASMIYGERRSA